MAYVEISHDDAVQAYETLGSSRLTGRMRWWVSADGERQLQCEWESVATGMSIWIEIPTLTELKE